MLNTSLGGLIKDYRLQKGISQIEIAFSLGWKETSRLSRIEQGKILKPPKELIDKLMDALKLETREKNGLLLVGNYLPTSEEIAQVRKITEPMLNSWPYPATVLDFSWRVINENKANIDLYQLSERKIKEIYEKHIRVLKILLDPDLKQNQILKGEDQIKWQTFLKYLILQFQIEQKDRTKEKWYIDHIKEMLNNALFQKLWTEAQNSPPIGIVGKFATKSIASPKNSAKKLNFFLFVVPVLEDPRFEMELLVPADLETYKHYSKS